MWVETGDIHPWQICVQLLSSQYSCTCLDQQWSLSLMTTEILSRGKTVPVLSEKLNTSKHVKSLANPAHKGKRKNFGSTNSIKQGASGDGNPEAIHTLPSTPLVSGIFHDSSGAWHAMVLAWTTAASLLGAQNSSVLKTTAREKVGSSLPIYQHLSRCCEGSAREKEGDCWLEKEEEKAGKAMTNQSSTFSLPDLPTESATHPDLFPQTPFLISITLSLI